MRDGWREVRLGDVLTLDIDKVDVESDATYRIAGVYGFSRGLFHREPIQGITTAYPALHRLREGQLVLSRLKGWEGAIAPVTAEFDGCFLSPEFPTFTPTSELPIDYLSLISQQPSFWELLRRRAVGIGGRKSRVKAETFLQTVVKLPPLPEQRRIVDILRTMDQLIHKANVVAVKAAAAAEALSRTLLAGDHPTSPLGEAVKLTLGRQVSQSRRAGDQMIPYLRAANVQAGFLKLEDVKRMPFTDDERERFRLEPGDVLIQEGGTPPGTTSAWHGELKGDVCFQNSIIRMRARPGVTIPPFVEVLGRWCHETGRFAAQGRRTHGIAHLGLSRAAGIPVPVPPIDEQMRVSDLLGSARRVAQRAELAAHRSISGRAALLNALLSGSHTVPASYDALFADAEGEVAA